MNQEEKYLPKYSRIFSNLKHVSHVSQYFVDF